MMSRDHSEWLINTLSRHREAAHIEAIAPSIVKVDRKKSPPAILGAISTNSVQIEDCRPLLVGNIRPQFILNIPNVALWSGNAIGYLKSESVAWGKMYDLYRALNNEDDLSNYMNPGLFFAERLFRQHDNVTSLEHISDQVYRLHRLKGNPLDVALTDAYEVTADAVRSAWDAHKPFDVLLKNTPYGIVSSKGRIAATELGIEICDQSSIFSRLAR